VAASLQSLKRGWDSVAVRQPFEYTFLDEEYDRLYQAEIRLGRIFSYVAALAIFIACLGLFGLASFAVERRTKEIGIRKVLGSSFSGLVWLLSREFTKAILVANVVAWPLAYVVMSGWLQNFAYRTSVRIWIFLLAAGLALGIAFLTLSFRLVRAARADPIASLRYE
jgi:putative ABC transport system permease protein